MGFDFKRTFVRGIALAIPLAIIAIVFIRILGIFKTIITPFAVRIGVDRVLGKLTLTIIACLVIFLLILFLGWLTQINRVASVKEKLENFVFKFFPMLRVLKMVGTYQLKTSDNKDAWKPVIVLYENTYTGAFLVEEDEELVTLFMLKSFTIQEGEILVVSKKDVEVTPVNYSDLQKCWRSFGKGYLALIKPKTTILEK